MSASADLLRKLSEAYALARARTAADPEWHAAVDEVADTHRRAGWVSVRVSEEGFFLRGGAPDPGSELPADVEPLQALRDALAAAGIVELRLEEPLGHEILREFFERLARVESEGAVPREAPLSDRFRGLEGYLGLSFTPSGRVLRGMVGGIQRMFEAWEPPPESAEEAPVEAAVTAVAAAEARPEAEAEAVAEEAAAEAEVAEAAEEEEPVTVEAAAAEEDAREAEEVAEEAVAEAEVAEAAEEEEPVTVEAAAAEEDVVELEEALGLEEPPPEEVEEAVEEAVAEAEEPLPEAIEEPAAEPEEAVEETEQIWAETAAESPAEAEEALFEAAEEPLAEEEAEEAAEAEERPAFEQEVAAFLSGDVGADEAGEALRSRMNRWLETRETDPLAQAVQRLVESSLAAPGSPAERGISLAREFTNPAVASRLVGWLGATRDEVARARLVGVVSHLGSEAALALGDALREARDRHQRRAFLDALVALGEDGREVVISLLEDRRWFVVRNGVAALGDLGGEGAIAQLTVTLAHEDARVRKETVWALAKIGGDDAEALLLGMLDDSEAEVRGMAARALGVLRAERAVKPLIQLLQKEHDEDVQVECLHALGQIGDPGAVPVVEKKAAGRFLSRSPREVRIAAYRALARIGTPHARALLVSASRDKDPDVRAAVRALL